MSVAKCLGLDDVEGPAMAAATVAWQRWCHQEPELAVVDDLLDLPDSRADSAQGRSDGPPPSAGSEGR